MNYASVFLVFTLLVTLVYWYISGRKFYTGPLIEAQFEGSITDRSSSENNKDKESKEMAV